MTIRRNPRMDRTETQFVFRGPIEERSDDVRRLWAEQSSRLDRLLDRIPTDLRRVRVTIEGAPGDVQARIILLLPRTPLAAEGEASSIEAALGHALDRIVKQVRRHRHTLLRDAADRRRRWKREAGSAVRALTDLHEHRDRSAFFDLLRPLMTPLRGLARHELAIARLEGRLDRDDLSAAEVVDEVLVRAWDRFEDRPQDAPLRPWLVDLLHEVLDTWCAEGPELVSMEGSVRTPGDGLGFDDPDEWLEAWVAGAAPVSVQELIPDPRVHTTTIETEEEYRRVLGRLRHLTPVQRRTLILHALDGWDESEIALLQGRDPDEVRADLDDARAILRERLRAPAGRTSA